jgi:hypothetical protein
MSGGEIIISNLLANIDSCVTKTKINPPGAVHIK